MSRNASAAEKIPHGTVELIAENRWLVPGRVNYVGLRFQLESGWHIYWQNPGDSGEPPRVTWHLPPGLAAGEMEWPVPHRLGSATIVDFGYNDGVLLLVPLRATPSLGSQPAAQIAGDLRVLVCREMCIPGKAQVDVTLPVKGATPAADAKTAAMFAAARKELPKPAPANWRVSASDTKDAFVLTANVGRKIEQATYFPMNESQIDNAAPQKAEATATGFKMTLKKSAQLTKPVERLKGVLVLPGEPAYVVVARVSAAAGK